jgi:BRCA1 C Terminus (BRCT) domain
MSPNESSGYFRYTGPQRLDKAIHTLEGILQGVAADSQINDRELRALTEWLSEHSEFVQRKPFDEVVRLVNAAVTNRSIDQDRHDDLLWFCTMLKDRVGIFFDCLTADMQRLHGIVAGIMADGFLNVAELQELQEWIDNHRDLAGYWPFDELESVVLSVLADGKIDQKEHDFLVYFFNDFVRKPGSPTVENIDVPGTIFLSGICAISPTIRFRGKTFCISGESKRFTRNQFIELIESFGGEYKSNVSKMLDYLVIGSEGNPCWAYSCYGRKVESAVHLRRSGSKIVIVHENDLHDAIEDKRSGLL